MKALGTRILVFLFATVWSLVANAGQLVVFGDSLSDGGNSALAVLATGGQFEEIPYLPPPFGDDLDRVPAAPYNLNPANPFAARFSNGPVWAEQLAAREGMLLLPSLAGGTNFAFAGADSGPLPGVPADVIPTVRQQVDQFLGTLNPTVGAPSDWTYVVFGGGNDVRRALGITNYRDLLNFTNASATNLKSSVDALVQAGARDILVVLVPNVGLAPDVAQGGFGQQGTITSATINVLLLAKLKGYFRNPQVRLRVLDTFSLVSRVARTPAAYGLTEGRLPCVDFGSICTLPEDYLFWDGIHPTTAAHSIVADAAERALAR